MLSHLLGSRKSPSRRKRRRMGQNHQISSSVIPVAVTLVMATVLGFWIHPKGRQWALESLGFGWVVVGLWLIGLNVALRGSRLNFVGLWRRCVGFGAVAAISIGVLSLLYPSDGILARVSMGGNWGSMLAGTPVAQGIAKLVIMVLIALVAFHPSQIYRTFFSFAEFLVLPFLSRSPRTLPKMGPRFSVFIWRIESVDSKPRRLVSPDSVPQPPITTPSPCTRPHRSAIDNIRLEPPPYTGSGFPVGPMEYQRNDDSINPGSLREALDPLELTSRTESPDKAQLIALEPACGADSPDNAQTIASKPGDQILIPPHWHLPDVGLLRPWEFDESSEELVQDMGKRIEMTLAEHGVDAEVQYTHLGPRIIRFGLKPGWNTKSGNSGHESVEDGSGRGERVKVQSILALRNDLALSLNCSTIRMEAPMTGEPLIGLEVPNPAPAIVDLKPIIESDPFQKPGASGPPLILIGVNVDGSPLIVSLPVLRNLLLAGETGSGKSVSLKAIIATLLMTQSPDQVRMLMIDTKSVELTFDGIPHLLRPAITDGAQANNALQSIIQTMSERYELLAQLKCRNISDYNNKAQIPLPYIVIIIDEWADLLLANDSPIENNLLRLAAKGRAAGIHIILSTQRPSIQIVTGLLKANMPSRACFSVASATDSRVVLDVGGAEKLLGRGDMLFMSAGSAQLQRAQGVFVSDEELDNLVDFWLTQGEGCRCTGKPYPAGSQKENVWDTPEAVQLNLQKLEPQ